MNSTLMYEAFFYDFQKEALAFLKETESLNLLLAKSEPMQQVSNSCDTDLVMRAQQLKISMDAYALLLANQIQKLQAQKEGVNFSEKAPELLFEQRDLVRQIADTVQNLLDQVQSVLDMVEDAFLQSYEVAARKFLMASKTYRRFLEDTARSYRDSFDRVAPPGLHYRTVSSRSDDFQLRRRMEEARNEAFFQEERQREESARREKAEQVRVSLWDDTSRFSQPAEQVDDEAENKDSKAGKLKRVGKVAQPPEEPHLPSQKGKKGFLGLFGRKKKEKQPVMPPKMDSVRFSAVAPNRVEPGKYLPIHVIMYEDGYRKTVDAMLQSYGNEGKESQSGYQQVARDTMIRVVLTSAELEIEDPVEELRWQGNYLNFEFVARVPADLVQEQVLLTATVYINGIIATRLKLILDRKKRPKHNLSLTRRDIASAFVSYASQDRSRVATIIQGMQAGRPDLDIFFDIESLRSGQKWEQTLRTEIAKRDVLFLCWSQNAQKSPWVDMEWRYALQTKGEEGIEPIPIDSPEICPPPKELQDKHFNDKLLYVIQATTPK